MSDKHPLYDAEKNWPLAKKKATKILEEARRYDRMLSDMAIQGDAIVEMLREYFICLPETDKTSFGNSLIAPHRVMEYMCEHLIRSESSKKNFSQRLKMTRLVDPNKIPSFADAIKEGVAWGLKMEKKTADII